MLEQLSKPALNALINLTMHAITIIKPDKFPEGYIIELALEEWEPLKSKFSSSTEKGLYMLATILKGAIATKTTISIIETFSRVKEITKTIRQIPKIKENSDKRKEILHKTGELKSGLITPKEKDAAESKASIELNLAIVKFKYSLRKRHTKHAW